MEIGTRWKHHQEGYVVEVVKHAGWKGLVGACVITKRLGDEDEDRRQMIPISELKREFEPVDASGPDLRALG